MSADPSALASGTWKFHEKVEVGNLLELASLWMNSSEGPQYLDLHVRRCAKNQLGIGFKYRYCGGRDGYDAYFNRMTDLLKRKFGNDFIGWDVSSTTWVLK